MAPAPNKIAPKYFLRSVCSGEIGGVQGWSVAGAEMEKAADAVDAVGVNFIYRCANFLGFERVFQSCLPFFVQFLAFLLIF